VRLVGSTWHTGSVSAEESFSKGSPSIKTLSTREIYRNRWLRLREDRILRSNGKEGVYSVVDKDECAIILPIENDRVWLVEQFRYTIQQRAWELPQGGWEEAVVDPEALARGELQEETGLHAKRMVPLGSLWIAYGFTRQKQHVFLATNLTQAETDRDAEEHDLVVRSFAIADFERMMREGTIADASTLAAWGLYSIWKAAQPSD
jgi:8-oxo-dGTP pyrophosphatase MutT (NUDIX family)